MLSWVKSGLGQNKLSRVGVGGWLEQLRIRLSQLPTKLKLKLKLSLAIKSTPTNLSNDAESSSNHVLFWVCKFGVEFDNTGENSGPIKSWPVNSLGLNGIRLQRRPLMPIVSIAKLVLNEMVLCTGVHCTAHVQYILEKRLDTTQLSSWKDTSR